MGKIKVLFVLSVVLVLMTGCFSIPTGDGGKIKLGKGGVEIEGEDGERATIDVDGEEGGYSITTEKKVDGKDTNINFGSHAEVPADFPKDIPRPSDDYLMAAVVIEENDGKGISLSYQMEGDFEEYKEQYDNYLMENGYEVERLELAQAMITLMGTKGETVLTIGIMADDDESYLLQIMYIQ